MYTIARRNLNIHEYQSKELMDKYGITTQRWKLINNIEEAETQAKALGKFIVQSSGNMLAYLCY